MFIITAVCSKGPAFKEYSVQKQLRTKVALIGLALSLDQLAETPMSATQSRPTSAGAMPAATSSTCRLAALPLGRRCGSSAGDGWSRTSCCSMGSMV